MKKFILILAIIIALPAVASAWRGGGGDHVSVGFGIGGGYYPGYYAAPYPYPYYPAYPAYYPAYPQTVVVPAVQPYGTYAQPQAAPPQAANGYCREFTQNVVINGKPTKTYGTACQQPDGTWQTVSSGNPVQ